MDLFLPDMSPASIKAAVIGQIGRMEPSSFDVKVTPEGEMLVLVHQAPPPPFESRLIGGQ